MLPITHYPHLMLVRGWSQIFGLQEQPKLTIDCCIVKLLEVPISTPSESYYLELGVLPISVIIKARRINYLHDILSRDKSGMMYSFFITQWHTPSKGDWTEKVKIDLEDFQIPCSFDYIQSKYKEAFKKLVKVKAKEFALNNLKKKQGTHSKMWNVTYKDLKIQDYLLREDIKPSDKKTIFRYRTRMENFGENFRGGNGPATCPLCKLHLDNQEMSFQCPVIKSEITIMGDIKDVYKEDIKTETVRTIAKIAELRKTKLEK